MPPTANHWESAYLAPKFELARGWLRQLDTARDDIFYKEGALTDAQLRTLAAEQRDLLRRPARRAARLLLDRRAQADPLRPVLPEGTLPRRTLADLRSASTRSPWSPRSARGRANTVPVGPQGFALDVTHPGRFLVRVNFTPYWSIGRGSGCLLRGGDWTIARTAHTGIFSVDADFSLGGAWNAVTGAKKTC